ncbi:hypothetical protein B0T17DRAFT_589741 [Bombardia bombarda]|uniref:Uncharacterized protein n=1 Tax=Bombardia bombarda TaxID=252184 RepID=A0AA40C9H9_9PEZI|nr:hypothetical protein B0T17DRAFT_589741 [Bombardia bombarda]
MAGGFTPIDPRQCEHYAAFAAHLERVAFDVIYWLLFLLVILMLFLASWKYSGDSEAVQGLESGSREYRHRMKRCMLICSIYSGISVVAVVMEVYALMALQFCEGEDLMSLYWSTWAMMQVGALIAILGILLSVFNSLRGNKNPPWALALGTPVLVIAGLGHAFHGAMRKRVQRVRSRSVSSGRAGEQRGVSINSSSRLRGRSVSDLPISRQETMRTYDSEREVDLDYKAKLVGYTPEGAPILQFSDDPGVIMPERGAVMGRSANGQLIVAFRKEMTLLMENSFAEKPAQASTSASVVSRPAVVRIASPSRSPSRMREKSENASMV